jgi:hypothetical protein
MAKSKSDVGREAAKEKESIESLQQRYQALHTKKIQAETELKNARERLEDLKLEAREKFGTDDVAELQQKLEKMRAENEEKRAQYQADLDRIEQALADVEDRFAAPEKPANGAVEES